jgi:hypothetical protein
VDGFDQDEAEGDGYEGAEVLCCLLASKRDPLEALGQIAERECFRYYLCYWVAAFMTGT